MRKKKEYNLGDITKWKGLRNSDTKEIDGGYLYIIVDIFEGNNENERTIVTRGIKIDGVKNRSEAIKKYNLNPKNPNNYKFVKEIN